MAVYGWDSCTMADDWRKAISFSDRLSETTKMQTAHPGCPPIEASKYAKAEEEQARMNALSMDEYHELVAKTVQFLLASVDPSSVQDHHHHHHHPDDHVFPDLPATGARIGRYTDAEHFADGLFSEVFRARDPDAERSHRPSNMVALKVTNPAMESAPHNSAREARILKAAQGRQIIPLIETFQQPGGSFVLAFPYMPYDFSKLLRQNCLTSQSRRSILRDLFAGLAHLHSLSIIHRDVKPSNILLSSPSGPAYLADFGIAWSSTDGASEPADQKILDVGTTCYRPPELLFGCSAYGSELDMWAAGCVAAQVVCLNGVTLFDAGDLGSELALIKSIFQTLGTPDLDDWPGAARMPDWGKMNFTRYPAKRWEDILPGADTGAIDLVKHLTRYEGPWRLDAKSALHHPYLASS